MKFAISEKYPRIKKCFCFLPCHVDVNSEEIKHNFVWLDYVYDYQRYGSGGIAHEYFSCWEKANRRHS